MPISTPYRDTLRRRAVQRFVKDNRRSPSDAELNNIVFEEEKAYPSVDQVGIVGFDLERPRYSDYSSSAVENKNREAIFDDLTTASLRLDGLIQLLEDSHRGFYATSTRVGRLLSQTESRLDNLLLLNGSSDVFLSGIEETFDTQEFVNQSPTTATVESSYVTLGRTGYTAVDLDQVKISATTAGEALVVGMQATSPMSTLKADDGAIWEYLVYTREQQGRVTLVLTVDLPGPTYVGDVRLNGLPVSTNKLMTSSCFYSLDGSNWTALDPVEQVTTPEMNFQIGIDGVRKLQFTFSKEAADTSTQNRNRYVYIFSLDSLKIYADAFNPSARSVLECGPYKVVDESGAPVFFTKATFDACTIEPDGTSASFYLSKDGVSWSGVSNSGEAGNYISFYDSSASQASAFIDDTISAGAVVDAVSGMEDLDFQTDGVLNTYIDSSYVDIVPRSSVVVKRNIVASGVPDELLGAVPGWVFDDLTQSYSTTLYVESPSGRYLELGGTSARINGQLISGQVYLPQGHSVFSTSDANWIEVSESLDSVEELEVADPLYPYNHRYIVSGYSYKASFSGDQIYQGVSDNFGRLMSYRSPEEFAYVQRGEANFFKIFTIEDVNGNWYIKVKVDKSDASWKQELFSVDWSVQTAPTNDLYVKALLSTDQPGQTPRIDSFKVRVI